MPPKKLILILASEGYIVEKWRPMTGSLMGQTLPDSSSPLEPYKSYVNFLHPMTDPSFRGPISGHQAYATIFWGGSLNSGGQYPTPTSATLDQVVAKGLATSQPLRLGKRSTAFALKSDLTDMRIYARTLTAQEVQAIGEDGQLTHFGAAETPIHP